MCLPGADRLRSARAAVKTARARRREAIAAVKDDANQQLLDAHDKLRAAQKDLYRRYCTNGDRRAAAAPVRHAATQPGGDRDERSAADPRLQPWG